MIWVVIILIGFALVLNGYLIHQINDRVDAKFIELNYDFAQAKAMAMNVDKRLDDTISIANGNDSALAKKVAEADRQIEEIISRMDYLAKTIEKVDADEKEIRSYYCNFREPRFDNAGVEWPEEYVTHDD